MCEVKYLIPQHPWVPQLGAQNAGYLGLPLLKREAFRRKERGGGLTIAINTPGTNGACGIKRNFIYRHAKLRRTNKAEISLRATYFAVVLVSFLV